MNRIKTTSNISENSNLELLQKIRMEKSQIHIEIRDKIEKAPTNFKDNLSDYLSHLDQIYDSFLQSKRVEI